MQPKLPDFTKANVLVIGDIMLDRYGFGETERISPEAPVPVVKIKQMDARPGGAGNVALNIAALGATVTLLGVTGDDEAAQRLEEQLAGAKVNHHIQKLPEVATIAKLRIISRNQQLIRLDFEEKFPAFDPERLISTYKKTLQHVNLVILSDYNKGTLTAVSSQLIKLAKEANIPVLVDPKGTDFSLYSGAHIITPNLKEFEAIVGRCHHEKDILQKGQQFLYQYQIDALLLTRGEQGMTFITRNSEEFHLPAHAREVFDVTGAGDTVIAMLGSALAAQASLPDAVILANFAASLAVSKLGAATVSVPELQVALATTAKINSGILNEEQLLLAVTEARLKEKKVVFTNGCFDILHAGHVTYLQQAKQLGDYLIVAINDDHSVKKLKGANRPINTVEQRMTVLAGLGVVDWVISFSHDTPEHLLKLLQPDVLVKGGDYKIEGVVGAEIVHAYGGEVRVLGEEKNISTTAIINRVVNNHQHTEE